MTAFGYTFEPTRYVRARSYDFGYDHEVQIALPPGYATSDRSYPVLWVMDGGGYLYTAVSAVSLFSTGQAIPEFIVVGVGDSSSFETFATRRLIDFFPMEDLSVDSIGEVDVWSALPGGHAADYLSFLVDELRPSLESEFRMSPSEHTIAGLSGGGYFATYTLLTRPEAFAAYMIGSPPYSLGHAEIFEYEEKYAQEHTDLPANVYMAGGAKEIFEPGIADLGIIESMVRMASTLHLRRYPNLRLSCDVVDGATHTTMMGDLLRNGLPRLWGKADAVPVNMVDRMESIEG
ncbi:MAG: alpha/beta hydrolase-fold protein [Mycobacterium sp.]